MPRQTRQQLSAALPPTGPARDRFERVLRLPGGGPQLLQLLRQAFPDRPPPYQGGQRGKPGIAIAYALRQPLPASPQGGPPWYLLEEHLAYLETYFASPPCPATSSTTSTTPSPAATGS